MKLSEWEKMKEELRSKADNDWEAYESLLAEEMIKDKPREKAVYKKGRKYGKK